MAAHHRPAGDDGAVADAHPRVDDAPLADPHVVADRHGADLIGRRRLVVAAARGVRRVAVGVEDPRGAGDVAVLADRDALAHDEEGLVAHRRVVADLEQGPLREAGREGDGRLAVEPHVAAEDDVPLPLHEVDEAPRAQAGPALLAVGLEEGLGDEHPHPELGRGAGGQVAPEQRPHHRLGSRDGEAAHLVLEPPHGLGQRRVGGGKVMVELRQSVLHFVHRSLDAGRARRFPL